MSGFQIKMTPKEKRQWLGLQNGDAIRNGIAFVTLFTTVTFALAFVVGFLCGLADPDGWAAWRVGVIFGAISGGIVLFMSTMWAVIDGV